MKRPRRPPGQGKTSATGKIGEPDKPKETETGEKSLAIPRKEAITRKPVDHMRRRKMEPFKKMTYIWQNFIERHGGKSAQSNRPSERMGRMMAET